MWRAVLVVLVVLLFAMVITFLLGERSHDLNLLFAATVLVLTVAAAAHFTKKVFK